MPAIKPLLIFSSLLALSLTAGWRSGAASAMAAKAVQGERPKAAAGNAGFDNGKAPDGNAAPASVESSASPDTASVRKELESLLHMMDDDSRPGMDGEFFAMWGMARMAFLMQKLTPAEQESVFAKIPGDALPMEDIQEARMMIQAFGMMMGGGKGKTSDDYIKELGAVKKGQPEMAMMTLLSWASKDTPAALQYWKSQAALPEPPEWVRENGRMIFANVAMEEPVNAVREALSISDEKLRHEIAGGLPLFGLFKGDKKDWPADGTETVKALLHAVPENSEILLLGALSGRMRQETPQEGLKWVESLNLGPEAGDAVNNAVLSAWWGKNPQEAAAWRMSQIPPEKKADEVEQLVRRWTNAGVSREARQQLPEPDIAGCADWILSLGIGPDTEKGISRLADGWIDAGEPAAAIAWARAIPNPEARQASLDNVTTQIRRRYPDTWRAMLTAAGLPVRTETAVEPPYGAEVR